MKTEAECGEKRPDPSCINILCFKGRAIIVKILMGKVYAIVRQWESKNELEEFSLQFGLKSLEVENDFVIENKIYSLEFFCSTSQKLIFLVKVYCDQSSAFPLVAWCSKTNRLILGSNETINIFSLIDFNQIAKINLGSIFVSMWQTSILNKFIVIKEFGISLLNVESCCEEWAISHDLISGISIVNENLQVKFEDGHFISVNVFSGTGV